LDGLVLTPVGGRGEGLFAMARTLRWSPPLGRLPGAEVVASAGEPLGAEVAAAAGEPSVQRWSPPLVRLPGAEVIAVAGEPLRASYPRDPTGVEVVHTCRVEMELGLRLKADVILLLFVRYF
jgi:hypothetical protein